MSELILFNQNGESVHHLVDDTIHVKNLRSPLRGVSIQSSPGLWRARKRVNGVCEHLGYHASDIAASMAYKLGSVNSKPFKMSATEVAQMRILINDGSSVNSVLQKVTHVASQQVLFNNKTRTNLKIKRKFQDNSDNLDRKKRKISESGASDFDIEIPFDEFESPNSNLQCKNDKYIGTCAKFYNPTIDFDIGSMCIIHGEPDERIGDELFRLIWQ